MVRRHFKAGYGFRWAVVTGGRAGHHGGGTWKAYSTGQCGMHWEVTGQGEKPTFSQGLVEARQQECTAGQACTCKIFAYLDSVFIVDF